MGFLKDASESIIKYSGILVNKTEEYTKIAKLNLEIKKLEGDIDKIQEQIGRIVEEKANSGAETVDVKDTAINRHLESIKELRSTIGGKKNQIEELKKEAGVEETETAASDAAPGDDTGSNT